MAGSTLAIGVLALTAVVGSAVGAVGAGAIRAAQVSAAADAAALAAADAASGAVGGEPCQRAGQLAQRAGVRVVDCDIDGLVATVEVAGSVGLSRVHARARAGPPEAAPRGTP